MTSAKESLKAGISASKRDATLDALYQLMLDRPWKDITMDELAKAAGVSRQTLYNEFGSRSGVAEAYIVRLSGGFSMAVEAAMQTHRGDAVKAIEQANKIFLELCGLDPLFALVRSDNPPADLLRLLSCESGIIDGHATQALSELAQTSWMQLDPATAGSFARQTSRLCLQYAIRPPDDINQARRDLGALLGGYCARNAASTTD